MRHFKIGCLLTILIGVSSYPETLNTDKLDSKENIVKWGHRAAYSYIVGTAVFQTLKNVNDKEKLQEMWGMGKNAAERRSKQSINQARQGSEAEAARDALNVMSNLLNLNTESALKGIKKLEESTQNVSSVELIANPNYEPWMLKNYERRALPILEKRGLFPDEKNLNIVAAELHNKAHQKYRKAQFGMTMKIGCRMAAIASLAAVRFKQESYESKILQDAKNFSDQETAQVESLYAISRVQKGKATDAKLMTGIFSTLAACFTTSIIYTTPHFKQLHHFEETKGVPKIDLDAIISASLSLFVATGYMGLIGEHRELSEQAKAYADAIPQKESCDDKGSSCFCLRWAEKPEQHHEIEYAKYCKEELALGSYCINQYGNYDPTCKCQTSNSCFDQSYRKMLIKSGVPADVASKVTAGTKRLISKDINSSAKDMEKQRAFASKVVNRAVSKLKTPKNLKLSSKDKAKAKYLNKNGVPKKLAAVLSKMKAPKNNKNNDFMLGSYEYTKRARGLKKGNSKKSNAMDFLAMFGHKKKSREPSGGVEFVTDSLTMSASRQAVLDKASIHYNQNEPIFNIISGRYLQHHD